MTGSSSAKRTSLCLVALVLSCLSASSVVVVGAPEPPSRMIYSDNFPDDQERLLMVGKLKQWIERKQEMMEQERELAEEQMAIQEMLVEKERAEHRMSRGEYSAEDPEVLPVPSAVVRNVPLRSGKRTYLTLCHFKICNMGRKRQL